MRKRSFAWLIPEVLLLLGFLNCFSLVDCAVRLDVGDQFVRYYLAVAVVARNEGLYLPEWIEYHLVVGVQHFFFYDNDSDDDSLVKLGPFLRAGLVTYTFRPGKGIQIALLNEALKHYGCRTFWMALIDVDEFLVPVSAKSVSDLLTGFEHVGGLAVSWLVFAPSNEAKRGKGLVIERFHASVPRYFENCWCKLIVQPSYVVRMESVHHATFVKGNYTITTHHTRAGMGSFTGTLPRSQVFHDVIRINHYPFKSEEEFAIKKRRGGGVHGPNWRKWLQFHDPLLRRTEIDNMMGLYVPLVKNRLLMRYGLSSGDTSLW
jgi:hypothetical protein